MPRTSASHADLQIADYTNWAVYRKWERGDEQSHLLVREATQSEVAAYMEDGRDYH